jgi:thiaminase
MNDVLEKSIQQLSAALERFPWTDPPVYCDWLAQTYYYVRHSTRLLAAAAGRFPFDENGDALHHRFSTHMKEEKKHEQLALRDLNVLQTSIDAFEERPVTRLLYEPQYYKIEHQDPVALLGYILALEGMSATRGKWVLEQARRAHPARSTTFLEVHAHDDEDHLRKAVAVVSGLGERQAKLVEENLQQTTFAYTSMLAEISARVRGVEPSLRADREARIAEIPSN